jgi:hypothetical protein
MGYLLLVRHELFVLIGATHTLKQKIRMSNAEAMHAALLLT